MRIGVYTRISRDSTGHGAGVARQEEDCRAKAEANGWTVVRVYSDNDISAYSGTPRPGYCQLLEDIKAGQLGAVLAMILSWAEWVGSHSEQFAVVPGS